MSGTFGLGPEGLRQAFPFHMVIDLQGRIVQRGPSLLRLVPDLRVGDALEDIARLVRPTPTLNVGELFRSAPEFFVLELVGCDVLLRGQTLAQGDHLLFLGSPWLTHSQQLEDLNLRLSHFALHDPVIDYVALLQSKNSSLEDANRLAAALTQALDERERARSRLSALMSRLPYGVLAEDESGNIALTNQAFCDMFRIQAPPEALVGGDCSEAAAAAAPLFRDPAGFLSLIAERLTHRIPVTQDVLELVDGRVLERDYVPVFEGETYRGHLWLYRDVTEARRGQEELLFARARAEEANHAKGAFLAMMSHEMRTPLGVVVGLSDLLAEELSPHERTDYLARLRANASALLALVDEVLDFSRLESHAVELHELPFSPAGLVDDVRRSLAVRAEQKGLALEFEVDARIPRAVIGDENRLRQVLVNLLTNAVKFTSSGHVRISARVLALESDGATIRYEVSDTGRGIPADMQQKIFERFVRLPANTTQRSEGTGLGLTICRTLVEKMGSEIRLSSAEGTGSSFWFDLEHPLAYEPLPAQPERKTWTDGNAWSILLAEDDPDNRLVLTQALERAGYDVDVANDGTIALEKAKALDYDLLITDVSMPNMDGFELTQRLRELEAHSPRSRLPIVGLSAHALANHRERATAVGMDAYLTKPIGRGDLLEAVNRHVDRRKRVMIVDDSEDAARVLSRLVERCGPVRALWASDGARAVARALRSKVSLVLLDGQLFGMSGEDTARALRRQEGGAELPIVAVTGEAGVDAARRYRAAGCNEHVAKPVSKATVKDILERYVLVPGKSDPSPSPSPPSVALALDPEVSDMIPGYLLNRRADVARLRAAIGTGGRFDEVRSIGHKMKGTGKAYGFAGVSELGDELERAGAQRDRERITELSYQLERHLDEIEALLSERRH
ncbi:MAG: response regulator [Deltaproteobacteria bacterium]|nr:response regulator [Deltaproteobacteria bacterium]